MNTTWLRVRSEGLGIPSPHLGCHSDVLFGVCVQEWLDSLGHGFWSFLYIQRLPGSTVDRVHTSFEPFGIISHFSK